MRVHLKGIHKVRKRLASGQIKEYYYAWRGGPPIKAAPGTAEFIRQYQVFDHEHFLRHLGLLVWICEEWEKSKLGKPKPNADEKQQAAVAALYLLKKNNIDPTKTKTGIFCKLAAVLYGDKSADLQHHCRAVLSRRVNPG